MKLLFPAILCFVNVFIMLICVIVPRKIRRKFLAGFLTGLYDQSHRCARVRVGRSDLGRNEFVNAKNNEFNSAAISLLWHPAAFRLTWLAYSDGRKRENYSV